jgi:hypothetical protein
MSGSPWFQACERSSLSELQVSDQRPCLYFDVDELKTLRDRVDREAWAGQNAESILANADEWISKGPYEAPEEVLPTVGRVQEIRRHVPKSLGLAYALTEDVRYAEKVREALVYLSEIRPEGGLGRETGDYGYTCGYAIATCALLYDMAYASGVYSAQDRHKIESMMRASFEGMRLSQDNMKFHNRAAVCMGGMAAVAFCLQDRALIDWVLNGPYGFHRHMASVPEDGLWEEGPSYAFMTFGDMGQCAGYMAVAECAYHAGIDLYQDPSLLKLLLTPMMYAFPDMTMSGHGHAGSGDSIVDRALSFIRPYVRTGDPRFGWVLREAFRVRGVDRSSGPTYLWSEPVDIPEDVDFAPDFGTTHFPNRGLVMLRTGEAEAAINLLFDYGYTGGHAHPDKMNIALYANGRVQAPDGILLYTVPEAFTYNGQPVGHNTVVVDERCQHPSEFQNLRALVAGGKIQIADADDAEAYDDVNLRRTVLLTETYVADFFRVEGSGAHRYDWVYHNLGEMQADLPLAPHAGSLGMTNGYNHVRDVSKHKTVEPWQVLCTASQDAPDEAVRVQMPGGEPTEVILGMGRGVFRTRPEEDMPVLLARRFCESTVYTATIEPHRGRPGIREVRRIEASRRGKAVDALAATGLSVATDSGVDTFLMVYDGKKTTFDDSTLDGEILALSVGQDGRPVYLQVVNARSVRFGKLTLRADPAATVRLCRMGPGSYRMENQGAQDVEVTVGGLQLRGPVIYALNDDGKRGAKVAGNWARSRLTFSMTPNGLCEIVNG